MRISSPGNDEGFVVFDAIVSLFIAGIAAVAVLGFAGATLRYSSSARERAFSLIESRNAAAAVVFGNPENE